MTCEQSRHLIHLDRPDERTALEAQELERHLQGCASCAAEALRVRAVLPMEQRIRETRIPIPILSDVRARVWAQTAGVSTRDRRSSGRPWRIAYAAAAVLSVVWFAGDQWMIQRSHEELGQRILVSAAAPTGPQIVYTVDAATARSFAERTDAAQAGWSSLEGKLEVPQSTVDDLVSAAEFHFVRTIAQRPERRAKVAEAIRIFRSAVDVTIRYRSKGV